VWHKMCHLLLSDIKDEGKRGHPSKVTSLHALESKQKDPAQDLFCSIITSKMGGKAMVNITTHIQKIHS
jgi:hypothetical protein